jgi:hypothetical protein
MLPGADRDHRKIAQNSILLLSHKHCGAIFAPLIEKVMNIAESARANSAI